MCPIANQFSLSQAITVNFLLHAFSEIFYVCVSKYEYEFLLYFYTSGCFMLFFTLLYLFFK